MKAGLKRWVGRAPDISAVLARFPVAVGVMAIFTVIIIFFDNFGDNDPLGRMLAGLIVGAYLSFCITVMRESKGKSPAVLLQIGLAFVVAVLAWFSTDLRLNLPMAIGAVLLILGNMVIWKKSRNDLHVWDFTHKIWTGAVFATVGSIIFTIGVFAIQAALKSLFGINIKDLIEYLILPIGLGFLAPLYWLSTTPKVDESYDELYDNPGFVSKAVAFMGTWLLSPLTLIYALILLAYGVKIILAGSLPKGEIAQLTTPFLIIGTLTWLVLEPPFIKEKALAKVFRKLWFPISIPAALMLGISIFVRIGEYGFTPERIALLMAVIWSLGIGLWFTFGPKTKRDIRLVPGFAAVLLCLGVFGTEVFSVQSQTSRAIEGLKTAGIMSDAGVVKPLADIDITNDDAAIRAQGSLAYLLRHKEKRVLNKIFKGAEHVPSFDKYKASEIYNRLALEDIALNTGRYQKQATRFESKDKRIEISGYESLYGSFYYNTTKNDQSRTLYNQRGFTIKGEGPLLKFFEEENLIGEFDISVWVDNLPVYSEEYRIDDNKIIVEIESQGEIAIYVTSIDRWDSRSDHNSANINFKFFVMTKGF